MSEMENTMATTETSEVLPVYTDTTPEPEANQTPDIPQPNGEVTGTNTDNGGLTGLVVGTAIAAGTGIGILATKTVYFVKDKLNKPAEEKKDPKPKKKGIIARAKERMVHACGGVMPEEAKDNSLTENGEKK